MITLLNVAKLLDIFHQLSGMPPEEIRARFPTRGKVKETVIRGFHSL